MVTPPPSSHKDRHPAVTSCPVTVCSPEELLSSTSCAQVVSQSSRTEATIDTHCEKFEVRGSARLPFSGSSKETLVRGSSQLLVATSCM